MPEDDLERLIAAHLDDALDADEAARLHARLRADGDARHLLIAAARHAAALPRLALEPDARAAMPSPTPLPEAASARPRAPWRWPAAAAVFIATVGLGMLIRTTPPPLDLRVDGQAQIAHRAAESAGGPWLHAGDRITTSTGPATLSWTSEGTRLELAPASALTVEVASGAKRLRLERGALQAEVAHQPVDGGVTIVTPFGRVEVVGTRFAVQIQEHGSTVTVERGAVRLVAEAAGQPAVRLESGYAATLSGAAISHPVPQATAPPAGATAAGDPTAGSAQVVHVGPADWHDGAGWEGDLVDGAIRARLQSDSPVTRIILPLRRPDGYLRLARDLRCTLRLHVDQATTCALLLVCDRADGGDWLGNLQGERRLVAGDQELVLSADDLRPVAGSGLTMPPGSRIIGIAVMTWGPAADLRLHDVELRR